MWKQGENSDEVATTATTRLQSPGVSVVVQVQQQGEKNNMVTAWKNSYNHFLLHPMPCSMTVTATK